MANLICRLCGVRGRIMEVYDNKCIIKTEVTAGSLLTHNATDGEKTIFYIDCTGVQFKESKLTIGYLQVETPSMQMNNQASNFFSENTFTFENGINSLTNEKMRAVYDFITERIEGYKYGTEIQPLAQAHAKLTGILSKGLPSPASSAARVSASPATPAERWVCSNCGTSNKASSYTCADCGSSKHMSMIRR